MPYISKKKLEEKIRSERREAEETTNQEWRNIYSRDTHALTTEIKEATAKLAEAEKVAKEKVVLAKNSCLYGYPTGGISLGTARSFPYPTVKIGNPDLTPAQHEKILREALDDVIEHFGLQETYPKRNPEFTLIANVVNGVYAPTLTPTNQFLADIRRAKSEREAKAEVKAAKARLAGKREEADA